MHEPANKLISVWRIPLLLAALTIAGLLSALLGTGAWRVISWIFLSVPIVVILWLVFLKKRK